MTHNALKYTLAHLMNVALPMSEPLDYAFDVAKNVLTVTIGGQYKLHMSMFGNDDMKLFMNDKGDLNMLLCPSADQKAMIPLFRPSRVSLHEVTSSQEDNELIIPFDLVTPSFYILSREEEHRSDRRDAHGRFRYQDSLAYSYNFIDLPLVDEYAMLLRKWIVEMLNPRLDIVPRKSRIIPTHDIDLLRRFHNPWQALKSIFGRDLILEHSIPATAASCREYLKWRKNSRQDPYIEAIRELAQESYNLGLESIFFFKAQLPDENDCTYGIDDPDIPYCMDIINDYGMKVGLHGSYDSYRSAGLLKLEKSRLEKVHGAQVSMVRQHYLRYSEDTLYLWQSAGLADDYTLCYAEQPGFRCGTCHPYPLYDTKRDCVTNIVEHPLIVMDGSLFDYLHLSISESNHLINSLLQRCQAVEGDFVILWHNHLLSRNYRKLYQKIYLPLLKK